MQNHLLNITMNICRYFYERSLAHLLSSKLNVSDSHRTPADLGHPFERHSSSYYGGDQTDTWSRIVGVADKMVPDFKTRLRRIHMSSSDSLSLVLLRYLSFCCDIWRSSHCQPLLLR